MSTVGLPRLDSINDLDATIGLAPAAINARETVRWNTAFAYLDAARRTRNLTIVSETLVDRVALDGGRALGIESANGRLSA